MTTEETTIQFCLLVSLPIFSYSVLLFLSLMVNGFTLSSSTVIARRRSGGDVDIIGAGMQFQRRVSTLYKAMQDYYFYDVIEH